MVGRAAKSISRRLSFYFIPQKKIRKHFLRPQLLIAQKKFYFDHFHENERLSAWYLGTECTVLFHMWLLGKGFLPYNLRHDSSFDSTLKHTFERIPHSRTTTKLEILIHEINSHIEFH